MRSEIVALVRLHEIELAPSNNAGQDRERLRLEMERCRSEISPALLARYERLKERYAAATLVEVENGICPGCRVVLPKTAAKRLKDEIVFCDHCGRILYDSDHIYHLQY